MKYSYVNRIDTILKSSSLNFLVFILLKFHKNSKASIYVLYLSALAIFEMQQVSYFYIQECFTFRGGVEGRKAVVGMY